MQVNIANNYIYGSCNVGSILVINGVLSSNPDKWPYKWATGLIAPNNWSYIPYP